MKCVEHTYGLMLPHVPPMVRDLSNLYEFGQANESSDRNWFNTACVYAVIGFFLRSGPLFQLLLTKYLN